MSRIEELLKEKCSGGVEYFPLLTVANVLYGYPCDASLFNTKSEGKPLARIRDVLSGVSDTYTTENVPERYELAKGDLLVGMDGNFHVANWKTDGGILCQRVCKVYSVDVENTITNGYLSHILGPIIKKIEEGKPSGTVKHLLDKDIKAIEIPVPPIEVQQEIVRILDKFTELEAELQAELDARKKQYEYYHDELLGFDERVNKIKVKDLFNRIKGTPITAGKMREIEDHAGEIRIFAGGKTVVNAKEEDIPNANITRVPAVLVQSRGVIDFVYYDKPFTFKNEMWAYTADNTVSVKFLFYYLKNNVEYFREVASGMGSLPQISLLVTENYEIAVPPIEVQQEIVRVLDKFTELEADLQIELDARKKQYKYYRDLLLSFERLGE